jgi:predicted amidohydrolase YtcJ
LTSPPKWLLTRAEVDGRVVDCRIEGDRVTAVGHELAPLVGEQTLDCSGHALLPGLADHHIHLWAAAAARSSLDLEGAVDLTPFAGTPGVGWLRVIGAGAALDRADLDKIWPDRPVRVQHRSGAMWSVNSEAITHLGRGLDAEERRTGQLWRSDVRLRTMLLDGGIVEAVDLAPLGIELARKGITHVTDATSTLSRHSVDALIAGLPQDVASLSAAVDSRAPAKIVVADHSLPTLDELGRAIARRHEHGRPVAVHAVTIAALALTVGALETVGAARGDRIEHAAVCSDDLADRVAALGVTVVTQPSLWAKHGRTFRRESPEQERPLLWRYAGLLARGVRVVASSDAPFGSLDPWQTIHASTRRASRHWPDESVSSETALRSMLADPHDLAGKHRRVQPGATADLVLLDRPLSDYLRDAESTSRCPVRQTFLRGQAYL